MLRRRNLLTTLLIALPWALLLTLWHQYPTTHYLSLLRSKCKSSAACLLVVVMIAGANPNLQQEMLSHGVGYTKANLPEGLLRVCLQQAYKQLLREC